MPTILQTFFGLNVSDVFTASGDFHAGICSITILSTIAEARLMQWSDLWEEHGFELYEVNESFAVSDPPLKEDSINSYDRVAAREVTETLPTSFNELERAAYQRLGGSEGRNFITWWIGKLRLAASSLQTLDFDAWKAKE